MIDIPALPQLGEGAGLSAGDFRFDVGDGSAAGWTQAPGPSSVTIRRGAGVGGSDRITLIWPDGVIRNTWLRVSVLPNGRTGLDSREIFYFGNLVGDTGGTPAGRAAVVNALDLANTRRHLFTSNPTLIARYDHNRDGRVSALDLAIVRNNLFSGLAPLNSAAPAVAPPPVTSVGGKLLEDSVLA